MKYCENCGYQTENDQITYCPCCDTPLVIGNQFKIINQYNVHPKNEPVKSVLLKIAFPLIWMIIILMIMLVTVVNKETIREAVQATPQPSQVDTSTTTQDPIDEEISNTENYTEDYTEEVYDNLADENAQTQTNTITNFDGLVVQPNIFFSYEEQFEAIINTDHSNLRLRSGPGTTYEVLELIPKGEVVTVVAKSDNIFSWIVVAYKDKVGWVSADYLLVQ